MLADSKDAFRLNACKKVVRLSKLIHSFSVEAQDRCDQINQVHLDFQNACQAIVDRFNREATKVSKDLNQFRKEYISDTCDQFSTEYKSIKREFTKYKNSQIRKINAIIIQSKNLQQTVQLIQNSALQTATDTLTSASEMEENLQNHTSPEYIESFVRPHIQPILLKIEKYQSYSDDRIRRMKKRFEGRSDTLTSTSQSEIRNYYRQVQPYFEAMKYRLKDLKANIFDSKMHVSRIIEQNKSKVRINLNSKNSFLRETTYMCKDLDDRLFLLRERQRTVFSTLNIQLSDMKNSHQTKTRNHNFKLELIDKMIAEKEKQYRFLVDHWESEMEKRVVEIGNDNCQSNRKSVSLTKQKRDEIQLLLQQIKECDDDSYELIEKLKTMINESIDASQRNLEQFQKKMAEQEVIMRRHFQNVKDVFTIHRRGRILVLQKASDLHTKSDNAFNEANKEEYQKMKKYYPILKNSQSKEMATVVFEYKGKMSEFSTSLNEGLNNHIGQLDAEFNEMYKKMTKESTRIKTGFSKDVQSKAQHINNMIDIKLTQLRSSINQNDFPDPNDYSVRDKLQLQLGKIDGEILALKNRYQKVVSEYDSQLKNIEKVVRKFKRNMQNETNMIKSEYEMKIQVAQVTLKEKLENLSKIYDPDENQRGCDVIELFRKVQEIKSQTFDEIFLIRQKGEKEVFENRKKIQVLKDKINWFSTAEKDLEKRLSEAKERAATEIPQLQKVFLQEKLPLQSLINELNNKYAKERSIVKAEIDKDNKIVSQSIAEIEAARKQTRAKCAQQIQQIDHLYSAKISKVNNEHQNNVDRLKEQIAFARQKYDTMSKEHEAAVNSEWSTFSGKLRDNIAQAHNQIRNGLGKNNHQLDVTILEKVKKLLQYDFLLCNIPPRRADKKKIETVRSSVHDLDNKIEIEFNTHEVYLKQPYLLSQKIQSQKPSRLKSVKIILESTYPSIGQSVQQIV